MNLAELLADFERRAVEGEAIDATAPVANVWRQAGNLARELDDTPTRTVKDRLISVKEASERSGMSTRWIYAHKDELPFVRQLNGSRAIRCSEHAFERWQAR